MTRLLPRDGSVPIDPHFSPSYNPFEQRLCFCPQGDYYKVLRDGKASIATDTIKNTVYVVAKENDFDSVERFAVILCRHFLATYAHVSAVKVELSQSLWRRIDVDGEAHDHAFVSAGALRSSA